MSAVIVGGRASTSARPLTAERSALPRLLDDAVHAIEAWDTACLNRDLRAPGRNDTRLRVLGARVNVMHAAFDALAAAYGRRPLELWEAMQTYRRATRAHVRDALVAVLGVEPAVNDG